MKKLGNKGFFLAETIVVVGIVATILALLYSQIAGFYSNYERSSKYNTVESVHAVRNIANYAAGHNPSQLVTAYNAAGTPLFDITTYDFDATGFYDSLVYNLNIDKVYFSSYNINTLFTNYASYNINAALLDYLKTLRVRTDKANTYRIIIVLKDGTYSNYVLALS